MIWVIKLFRTILAFFDKLVFNLIGLVYELFMLISEAGIFSQATIQEFATRIYIFLGLIMVFKVSISLVTYILNPDNFNKAEVGAPALLKGFAFALIGIVLVPYVFEAAFSLQRIILKDNLIGNLIMGMDDNDSDQTDYLKNAGKNISFVTLTAFIRLDSELEQISEACSANPVDVDNSDPDKPTGILSTECSEVEDIMGEDSINMLIKAYTNRSIKYLTDYDLLNETVKTADNKDEFVVNYLPVVSTAAGLFISYILLLFCIDIAVRSVKLGFLQLIAPIPLIAKVDPKKGGKIFDKWLKECTTTYLDVFVRLIAIYFVLFIISAITTSGNSGIYNVVTGRGYSGISGAFVKVFIILGALSFAKEIPNLIKSIFGLDLKASGGFTLSAKKKFGDVPLLGKPLVKTGQFVGRTGANLGKMASKGIDDKFDLKNKFNNSSAGLAYSRFKDKLDAGRERFLSNPIGNDLGQLVAESVPFMTERTRKKQDDQVKALETLAGYKQKLKDLANYDNNSRAVNFSYKDSTGTMQTASVNSSTKDLKQRLEDIQNSGTATTDQIIEARTAYEESQKLTITDGKFEQVKDLKKELSGFVVDNIEYLNGLTIEAKDATGAIVTKQLETKDFIDAAYETVNTANIQANTKTGSIKSSSGYRTAHSVTPATPKK